MGQSFCPHLKKTIKEACNLANTDIFNHLHLPLSMVASRRFNEFQANNNPLVGQIGNDIWNMTTGNILSQARKFT
jgi:hypothetical protein